MNKKDCDKKSLKKIRFKGLDFEVSECGECIKYEGRYLKRTANGVTEKRRGYYIVSANNKRVFVHQLVAEAYLVNPKVVSYKFVLFKDSNTLNTHKDNLYFGNRKMVAAKSTSKINEVEYRGTSTIPYEEAIKIAKRLDAGEYANSIAKEYNVSEMSINRIRKRYAEKKVVSAAYPKDVREVSERLLQKYSAKEVANITKIPYETVWRWSKKLGLKEKELAAKNEESEKLDSPDA